MIKKYNEFIFEANEETSSNISQEIKDEVTAEKEEKIVHIHFDSKYKVQHFTIKTEVEENLTETDEDSNEEIKSEIKIDQ